MRRSFSITQKIWLSLSILIIGYFISMVFGFYLGRQTEMRLHRVSASLFPAARESHAALAAFRQQISQYYNAVLFGEESFIETATTNETAVRNALLSISKLEMLDQKKRKEAEKMLTLMNSYTTSARKDYLEMIKQFGANVSEYDETRVLDERKRLLDIGSSLAQQTTSLKDKLTDFAEGFSKDLRVELSSISSKTRRHRYINMIVFFAVVISGMSLVTIIVSQLITRPLKRTFMLENVVRQSIDGIAVADMDGHIEFVNSAWAGMHGYKTEELMGKHMNCFYTKTQLEEEINPFFKTVSQKGFNIGEIGHIKKDGAVFSALMATNILKDKNNMPVNYVSIARDITEEKKRELEHLIASVSSVFINLSAADIQIGFKKALKLLFDYIQEDWCAMFQISTNDQQMTKTHEFYAKGSRPLGETFGSLPPDDFPWDLFTSTPHNNTYFLKVSDLPRGNKDIRSLMAQIGIRTLVSSQIIHNNQMIGLICMGSRDRGSKWMDKHVSLVKTISDIFANVCARQQAEEDLVKYQEQLRQLSSELILTEERERRQIATDLHDRIGQALASSKIKIGLIRKAAADSGLTEALDEVRMLIDQTIKDTRSLTFELSPPILYELGLSAAIDWLAEQIQKQHGIHIQFNDTSDPLNLDSSSRVLIFQSIREILFNVVKHSRASRGKVSLIHENNQIKIDIEDDGIGFDTKKTYSSGGFGLFSIRERLKQLKGYLEITSSADKGTLVSLILPTAEEDR